MRRARLVLAAGAVLVGTACANEARGGPGDAVARPGPAELERLWREGVSYDAFFADARRRRETWRTNRARAEAPPALLDRVAAAGGPWRLLVVAEDWCGDSAHNVPYLAELAERAPGLEMRIVGSRTGALVTSTHRTPDGRAATPTVVLLDGAFTDRGCMVERPPALQDRVLASRDSLPRRELHQRILAWYDEDAGRATLEEVVAVIEAAARGERRCPGPGERGPAG